VFNPWNEEGRKGNGWRMLCRAQGKGSMSGEARATLGGVPRPAAVVLPCFNAEGGRRGQVGRVGEKAK
jgi:hypothetical protein